MAMGILPVKCGLEVGVYRNSIQLKLLSAVQIQQGALYLFNRDTGIPNPPPCSVHLPLFPAWYPFTELNSGILD